METSPLCHGCTQGGKGRETKPPPPRAPMGDSICPSPSEVVTLTTGLSSEPRVRHWNLYLCLPLSITLRWLDSVLLHACQLLYQLVETLTPGSPQVSFTVSPLNCCAQGGSTVSRRGWEPAGGTWGQQRAGDGGGWGTPGGRGLTNKAEELSWGREGDGDVGAAVTAASLPRAVSPTAAAGSHAMGCGDVPEAVGGSQRTPLPHSRPHLATPRAVRGTGTPLPTPWHRPHRPFTPRVPSPRPHRHVPSPTSPHPHIHTSPPPPPRGAPPHLPIPSGPVGMWGTWTQGRGNPPWHNGPLPTLTPQQQRRAPHHPHALALR